MTQTRCNTKSRKGTHLTQEERERIKALHDYGLSNREIARQVQAIQQYMNNYSR